MAGIRQQRQRSSEDAADGFSDHEAARQGGRDQHARLVAGVAVDLAKAMRMTVM
jgi:hypothetical protein